MLHSPQDPAITSDTSPIHDSATINLSISNLRPHESLLRWVVDSYAHRYLLVGVMDHAATDVPSWLESRDENTGVLYTSPVDTINGSFTFPRQWPLNFRETSLINITWTMKYEGVNLYYYQRGKVAVSTQIASK
ncbi:hypothetical protein PFICI_11468 [Pestalotiopsis fici W106-1]|uniref:Uncharacterized protein n=1 Tax=Pestalotiopsis fici (strain W106-1 / CGMCC3.15140) TaxID=1229662 RepID=W3WTC4_PESFW|nr:uncharacterized protein PFICI_11468 [Pestalotiopsis fici W106-1]ETS76081.1 hypothetical protein PFICI_11468 [Pestalotiopsis fici W106-1]